MDETPNGHDDIEPSGIGITLGLIAKEFYPDKNLNLLTCKSTRDLDGEWGLAVAVVVARIETNRNLDTCMRRVLSRVDA